MIKEKTAPSVASTESGNSLERAVGASSQLDNTVSEYFCQIIDFIPFGRENAITAAELAALTGMNPRKITQLIEKQRKSANLICAAQGGAKGYYRTTDIEDAELYRKRLNNRIRSITRTLRGTEQAIERLSGQEKIKEW